MIIQSCSSYGATINEIEEIKRELGEAKEEMETELAQELEEELQNYSKQLKKEYADKEIFI